MAYQSYRTSTTCAHAVVGVRAVSLRANIDGRSIDMGGSHTYLSWILVQHRRTFCSSEQDHQHRGIQQTTGETGRNSRDGRRE